MLSHKPRQSIVVCLWSSVPNIPLASGVVKLYVCNNRAQIAMAQTNSALNHPQSIFWQVCKNDC